MSDDGNTLWAWQSQQPDGSWSILALYLASEEEIATGDPTAGVKYDVLIDRRREVMEERRSAAVAHQNRFGQAVRLAQFRAVDSIPLELVIGGPHG